MGAPPPLRTTTAPQPRAHRLQQPAALWSPAGLAALLVAALLAALLSPLPAASVRFILPAGETLPAGARVVGALPVAGAVIVTAPVLPPKAAAADQPLGFRALLGTDADGTTLDSGVATVGAPSVWQQTRGEGAVVALVDSGVAPVSALQDAIAGEIDFTGTGGGDPYGHGTFMASLIAGRGHRAPGVAPAAGIVSLKVGRADGTAYLGDVLAALQWLHGPGRAMGIRIVALALGVDADTPAAEFLDRAAANLAQADVLVITSAGNDGPGGLSSPATSTGTFSVGAVDDRGTVTRDDDVVAPFSATGPDRAGVAQPDVYAPGVSLVAHMHPDSVIYRENPAGIVDGELFRGTGTSMATALTAGVAALASSVRPDLGGAALEATVGNDAGILDAPDAVATALSAPVPPQSNSRPAPGAPPAWGHGRGTGQNAAVHPQSVRWTSVRWTSVRWTSVRWTSVRWTSVRWTSVRWTSVRWTGNHWADEAWEPARYGSVRWTGHGWASVHDLDDPELNSLRWTSLRWTSVRWG